MSNQDRCSICSGIPDQIVVRTERESLPAAFDQLKVIASVRSYAERQLRCCPNCHTVYDWEDGPQFMGTGNLDEEILTRLSAEESKIVLGLLDGSIKEAEVNELSFE